MRIAFSLTSPGITSWKSGGAAGKSFSGYSDENNLVQHIPIDYSSPAFVRTSIKENWKNYHYCLGRAPSVELSIGKYLTWLITNMPDHFMNLVVCTDVPGEGIDDLVRDALDHFRSLNIRKLSWLADEGVPATELRKSLLDQGLSFAESFATEMAIDVNELRDAPEAAGLEIGLVDDEDSLRKWIHVASVGFGVPAEAEEIWFEFYNYAACDSPFHTYLALLNGRPVATSQLFTSAGVAGIYSVSCLPDARGQGIGAAITHRALLDARRMEYRVGILQASLIGYNVYRRLGFEDHGSLSVYTWTNTDGTTGN